MARTWLKPRTALLMGPTEAAWLAGLFDGEGSVGCYQNGTGYPSWQLQISNTDRPALDRCVVISGAGRVADKAPATETTKAQWLWIIQRQRDIAAVLEQMLPYLVIKHAKAEEFLTQWEDIGV